MDDFSAENWNGDFGVDIPKIKLAKAWKELIEELKKIFLSGWNAWLCFSMAIFIR